MYTDYADSIASLQGGDKKTIRAITISAAVVFVVVMVFAVVWVVRRNSSKTTSNVPESGSIRTTRRSSRMAVECETDAVATDALEGASPAMIFVYADWCGFCKRADPIYAELAADPAYAHIKMLKLNSAKASKFVSKHGIKGFPVFLTNWGTQTKIVGYKPKADMETFLKAAPNPGSGGSAATRLAKGKGVVVTEDVAMAALASAAPAVVFVSADWCGFCKKLMPVWDEVASGGKFKHIKLMRIDAADAGNLVKKHGITGFPVLLSNKGEGKYIGYRPKEKLEEMLVTIGGSGRPTVRGHVQRRV